MNHSKDINLELCRVLHKYNTLIEKSWIPMIANMSVRSSGYVESITKITQSKSEDFEDIVQINTYLSDVPVNVNCDNIKLIRDHFNCELLKISLCDNDADTVLYVSVPELFSIKLDQNGDDEMVGYVSASFMNKKNEVMVSEECIRREFNDGELTDDHFTFKYKDVTYWMPDFDEMGIDYIRDKTYVPEASLCCVPVQIDVIDEIDEIDEIDHIDVIDHIDHIDVIAGLVLFD